MVELENEGGVVIQLRRRVREMETMLADMKDKERIVNISHKQLMEYENLKQLNCQLLEENEILW